MPAPPLSGECAGPVGGIGPQVHLRKGSGPWTAIRQPGRAGLSPGSAAAAFHSPALFSLGCGKLPAPGDLPIFLAWRTLLPQSPPEFRPPQPAHSCGSNTFPAEEARSLSSGLPPERAGRDQPRHPLHRPLLAPEGSHRQALGALDSLG